MKTKDSFSRLLQGHKQSAMIFTCLVILVRSSDLSKCGIIFLLLLFATRVHNLKFVGVNFWGNNLAGGVYLKQ